MDVSEYGNMGMGPTWKRSLRIGFLDQPLVVVILVCVGSNLWGRIVAMAYIHVRTNGTLRQDEVLLHYTVLCLECVV